MVGGEGARGACGGGRRAVALAEAIRARDMECCAWAGADRAAAPAPPAPSPAAPPGAAAAAHTALYVAVCTSCLTAVGITVALPKLNLYCMSSEPPAGIEPNCTRLDAGDQDAIPAAGDRTSAPDGGRLNDVGPPRASRPAIREYETERAEIGRLPALCTVWVSDPLMPVPRVIDPTSMTSLASLISHVCGTCPTIRRSSR